MDLDKVKKLGRNDLCMCDSGKKYKKCCLTEHQRIGIHAMKNLPEDKLPVLREEQERKHEFFTAILGHEHGYYLRHIHLLFKGKRVRAVYGTVHLRPPKETFHEFIIYIFTSTFGEVWRKEQMSLPEEGRHFIMKCYLNYLEWRKKTANDEELKKTGKYSGMPDGYTQWILLLAFDLYCLQHTKHLSESVLTKLKKNTEEFQGARYEIAVASIFARAGFDIEFLDDGDKKDVVSKKHGEFIATDKDQDLKIVVEAKSKQRDGVLHRSGDQKEEDLIKGNVHNLIKKALQKDTDGLPYFIFIDLNIPWLAADSIGEKPWVKDILAISNSRHASETETKENAIVFTNFSSHYQEAKLAKWDPPLFSLPLCPAHILPQEIVNKIMHVTDKYGAVPDLDMIFDELDANSSFS